ncbi:hypothetical protein G5I_08627 [Acromyrmex echinatior]|uniref:Uncharacterized protein n=1 Tax=Acromyrmex echinatior TaxID=103372 RepID=F4WS18_ACREC|nr:hypothetical protein G5I_08627 [Acromyrmex echinatior]
MEKMFTEVNTPGGISGIDLDNTSSKEAGPKDSERRCNHYYQKKMKLTRPAKVPTSKASREAPTGREQQQQSSSLGDSKDNSSRGGAAGINSGEPPRSTPPSSTGDHQRKRPPRDHAY